MKLSLTSEQTAEIQQLRDTIAKLHKEAVASNRERSRLESSRGALEKKISELVGNALSDRKARADLRDAQDELNFTVKRMEEMDSQFAATGGPIQSRSHSALRELSHAIETALKPMLDEKLLEITKQLRPLFTSDELARSGAWTSGAYCYFVSRVHRGFGHMGATHPAQMKAAVEFADEILSGEVDWKFDPKMS